MKNDAWPAMLGVYLFTVKTMGLKVEGAVAFFEGWESAEYRLQKRYTTISADTFVVHSAIFRNIVDLFWALLSSCTY